MPYALILDPEVGRAASYGPLLRAQGLEPLCLRDPEDAKKAFTERGPPMLLMMELSLPRVDGFLFLQKLRERYAADQVPVVVVSAFRSLRDQAVKRRQELGIHALLAAGGPLSSVERAIQSALVGITLPSPRELPAAQEERSDRIAPTRVRFGEDGPGQQVLQQIVEQTAREFGVSIALIAVVQGERAWIKAHVTSGNELVADRGGRWEWAFCQHAMQSHSPLFVQDAASHPLFAQHPLVQRGIVRSCLGAPLVTAKDEVMGALCIIDSGARQFTAVDSDALVAWSRRVAGELTLGAAPREETKVAEPVRRFLGEREAEARTIEALLDHFDEGVLLMNERREVLFANAALGFLLDVDPRSLVGMGREAWLALIGSRAAAPEAIPRQLLAPESGPFVAIDELELRWPERRIVRWTAKPFRVGSQVGQLATFLDITADRLLAEQREHVVLADLVTGALNRRGAEEAVSREVARARRERKPLAFAVANVDHFKRANDLLGHAAGDEMLRAVAQSLKTTVRGSDLVARWGGDEFLLVLPGANAEQARRVGEKVRRAVAELPLVKGVHVTLSVGTAELGRDERDPAQAFARADSALSLAKAAGRNAVR